MEISSAENQIKLSKALLEQNSSNVKLVCPQCKDSTPLIEGIEMSLMKSPLVRFKCKCLNKKKEELIDLEQYIHILLTEPHYQRQCFKHPEDIASIYCQNCSLNMCSLCYSYHISFEPTHSIIPIETERTSSPCVYHMNTELDFYCDDCNMNICIHCAKKMHSEHRVMQLREYWERVNERLSYRSNEALNAFLANQFNQYHSYVQNQFEKINAIIFNLQQIKAKLELKSKKVQKANKSIGLLVSLIFAEFFKGRSNPNFQLIQNVERLSMENLVYEDSAKAVFSRYTKIDEEIKHLINDVKDSPSNLITRVINTTNTKRVKDVLNGFQIEEIIEEPFLQPNTAEKEKISLSYWLNEDYDSKKKNSINNNSNCSTNSTNEERLFKMMQKEEILKSLNLLSNHNVNVNANGNGVPQHKSDYSSKQLLHNKTNRSNSKNTILIPRDMSLYSKHNTSRLNSSAYDHVDLEESNANLFKVTKKTKQYDDNTETIKNYHINNTKSYVGSQREKKHNNKDKESNKANIDTSTALIIEIPNLSSINNQNNDNDNDNKNKDFISKALQYDQCISTIRQSSQINTMAQLKTGQLISGGNDSVINMYNSTTFDYLTKIETNNNQILSLTELFDGSIAVGLNDNSIKLYDSTSQTCMMILIGHSKPVTAIVQTDITTILSCSEDNTIKRWDLTTKKCLMTYDEHCSTVTGVIRINETTMVSASRDSTLKLWNYSSTKSIYTLKAHSAAITSIIKLNDDQLATASVDRTIKFWDDKLQSCKGVLSGHLDTVSSIVQLNDGNLASVSFDSSMKIWDLNTMTCINTIIISSSKVNMLIQLFDGSIATASEDSLIKIWV